MSENNHFKLFVLCSGDVAVDVYHFHVKRIHLEPLVGHHYIVREDWDCLKTGFLETGIVGLHWDKFLVS
jgi:hypothetical protein